MSMGHIFFFFGALVCDHLHCRLETLFIHCILCQHQCRDKRKLKVDISMRCFSSVSSHFEFCYPDISNTLLHGCLYNNVCSFLLEEIGIHPAPFSFKVPKLITRKSYSHLESKANNVLKIKKTQPNPAPPLQ